jgi:hypothetical protein
MSLSVLAYLKCLEGRAQLGELCVSFHDLNIIRTVSPSSPSRTTRPSHTYCTRTYLFPALLEAGF